MIKFFKWFIGLFALAILAIAVWLYIAPPALIKVGANYTAKIVCSNVFIANRDPQEVLAIDVQAPGHPLLTVMQIDVDREAKQVKAGLFGAFGRGHAVYKEGFGCSPAPTGQIDTSSKTRKSSSGQTVTALRKSENAAVASILQNDVLVGPDMRAVIALKDGVIVGERYAEGFSVDTPLLGWSMAKTVTAAFLGTMVRDGTVNLDDKSLFEAWGNDDRKDIALKDLLGMASGLEWNEQYGSVTDVTKMLFLEPDMASFAKAKPLAFPIGETFNYSSGTSVLIAHYLQSKLQEDLADVIDQKLFTPLGLTSALYEKDASGTLVGGSHLYATARDWARLGQFLLQNGRWNGVTILPEGYVDWMTTPHPASDGEYGQGHLWTRAPGERNKENRLPFPSDAYWFAGHDGQSIAVIPSSNMVVVRLGLTPSKVGYKPSKLATALIEAVN